MQNVRDFPQTKLHGEINSPFLLNEHGDPRNFFQVFAKDSLIKNTFEEEKKFDSEKRFSEMFDSGKRFSENSSQLGVLHTFWLRRGLLANHRAVRKSAIFPQPSNQKQLK